MTPIPPTDSQTHDSVAIFGTGYVGLVTGSCLVAVGNRVTCYDIEASRIATLSSGKCPFYEPGLPEVIAEGIQSRRLAFTNDVAIAVADATIIFLAVGTPQGDDGSADLSYLRAAMGTCIEKARQHSIVVVRSTVPPGTGDELEAMARTAGRSDIQLVSAPEFLAEGTAVQDFLNPHRLVFGGTNAATQRVAALFGGVKPEAPRILTDRRTSELSKYASNTFLAARVSLINEFANLCDALGADVTTVSRIVGHDPRVGALFLRPGPGYGGSCFPKDVQAIRAVAQKAGIAVPVVEATEETNESQWKVVVTKSRNLLGGSFANKRVAVLGVAFKPDTDDTRSSASLRVIQALHKEGATIVAHDPIAKLPTSHAHLATQVKEVTEALHGADLTILMTEWREYRDLPWNKLLETVAAPNVMDSRNVLPLRELADLGFAVEAIGRRTHPEVKS